MDTLIYTVGVVAFFVGLMVSIALHEVGHMWPAKKFGVKVTEYFVGFGRRLWSFRRGETEYGLKLIPLGGYVKLVGMIPPAAGDTGGTGDAEHPDRVRSTNTGMFTQLVADARAAEYEKVLPGEEDRLFYRKPAWQKLIVMSGGPLVNIAIATFLFGVLIMGVGVPTATTTVETVPQCVVPADRVELTCRPGDPVSPAQRAGLRPGDQITSFNGTQVTEWEDLSQLIRANEAGDAEIGIERAGTPMMLSTNTTVSVRPSLDDSEAFVEVGFLGIAPTRPYERGNPLDVATTMGSLIKLTGAALLDMPERMVGVAKAAVGAEREPDSPVSVVGASRVAGELVSDERSPWVARVSDVVGLLASVNLFIAIFNFLPVLPLDGGHIAGALWEALRRGWARLRGRPDPGYFDVGKLLPLAYAFGSVLVVMGLLLVWTDIVNPVRLE
ncbi:MAG: RIP metalloprotease [Actinomycetota bacterium]|nr:RIP metalloprotease [Actinomycetota bacterium]